MSQFEAMRTTVRLEDELLVEAKRHAAETRRTLTELIRDALIAQLERERGKASPRKVKLPVFRGDGLRPGVNVNRAASILDRMEGLDE
jgi:hypothetical protein